jgi:hypothetical protein
MFVLDSLDYQDDMIDMSSSTAAAGQYNFTDHNYQLSWWGEMVAGRDDQLVT